MFVAVLYLLVTSNMYSPSTVKGRMGFHYYEKCFTFFPSTDVFCGGSGVGRCKTEGVSLNKRFVSVLHDWHRNYKELDDLNHSGEAVKNRKDIRNRTGTP